MKILTMREVEVQPKMIYVITRFVWRLRPLEHYNLSIIAYFIDETRTAQKLWIMRGTLLIESM